MNFDSILNNLEQRTPETVRGLSIAAVAGAFDFYLFSEMHKIVKSDTSVDEVDYVFHRVINSLLIERALDGRWRIRLTYRFPLEKYLKKTGNGAFAALNEYLAAQYGHNGTPPARVDIKGRLAYTAWLRHTLQAKSPAKEVFTVPFEEAFDKGWIGDTRAIVRVIGEVRPDIACANIEFIAMQGLQLYNEHHRKDALSKFLHIWHAHERPRSRLIAIALHLLGKESDNLQALNESLSILSEVKDKYGQAQVLHTRGGLYGKWNKPEEALQDLKDSLEIGRDIRHTHHQAQVLHTRGGLYGKWNRREEALQDLQDSLEIGRDIGHTYHQAQVLHTRGGLYGKWNRREEALNDLQDSLDLEIENKNKHGQAQVLHTRGGLYGKWNRREEALKDLKDSLEIGRDIGHTHHQAQVLSTRASVLLRGIKEGVGAGLNSIPEQLNSIEADLLLIWRFDPRPKNRSITCNFLAQAYLLSGNKGMAAGALRLKHKMDLLLGGGGIHQLNRTLPLLKELEEHLDTHELASAEKLLKSKLGYKEP